MSCGCAAPSAGLGIVALRGLGGLGAADDSAAPEAVVRPAMPALTIAVWIGSIATVTYIFYATLQPSRSRRSRRA